MYLVWIIKSIVCYKTQQYIYLVGILNQFRFAMMVYLIEIKSLILRRKPQNDFVCQLILRQFTICLTGHIIVKGSNLNSWGVGRVKREILVKARSQMAQRPYIRGIVDFIYCLPVNFIYTHFQKKTWWAGMFAAPLLWQVGSEQGRWNSVISEHFSVWKTIQNQ